ncbi:MAG: MFS transporter [Alphaproteobacteria bacterium]|nr:MAG: MFS transporter [Alphaproteobacteria bacterium]
MGRKIRIAFADESFTATLDDNASAREFAAMLPLDLSIEDFGGNEKIAHMSRKLQTLARGPVSDPTPGDLCIYVPWGNLAFFHDSYESTRDLVRLGRLDGGIAPMLVRGEFPLRIEAL